MSGSDSTISPRERVRTALAHQKPDRTPVDFLAVPEIWHRLLAILDPAPPNASEEPPATGIDTDAGTAWADAGSISAAGGVPYYDPAWEQLLRSLQVDCRVLSYDQFFNPPSQVLMPGAAIDWYGSLNRSTPNRMWRQHSPEGLIRDIWGRQFRVVPHGSGAYEELAGFPLADARSAADVDAHPWPDPDWWDFSGLPALLQTLDRHGENHLRYRMGCIFEAAWQLRGLDTFLMDMVLDPALPRRIMERLTEITEEVTERFLQAAGSRIDMLYFYDDVAAQNALLISREMWLQQIRPFHSRLAAVGKKHGIPVMYHCDGAVYPLIADLIDIGIDVLNPVQPDATGMDHPRLKEEFGSRLSFHGGIDIIRTLPSGTPADVRQEVRRRIAELGGDGGYIMAGSHHIQSDTPLQNVYAMYELGNRAPG